MCLAIYKPKGIHLPTKSLLNAFDNNPHGAGFAIARKGKIEVIKGFFKFEEFMEAYRPLEKHPAVIHFRWATHGKTDTYNCHPFEMCDGKYALIHNGILSIDTSSDRDKSDTAHYSELILAPLMDVISFDNPSLKFLVEEAIGTGNKLVMLRKDGKFTIFNEKQGHWCKGAWYSNYSYNYKSGRSQTVYGTDNTTSKWDKFYERNTDKSSSQTLLTDRTPGVYNDKGERVGDLITEKDKEEAEKEGFPDYVPPEWRQEFDNFIDGEVAEVAASEEK